MAPRTIIYTYDGLYRLTQAEYSTGESFAHAYDALCQRTQTTSTTPLSGTVVTTYTLRAEPQDEAYDWSDRGQMLTEWTVGYPVRTFELNGAEKI